MSNPKQELIQFHSEWLQNPITREFIDILKKREQKIIDAIGIASADEDSSMRLRTYGSQIQTLKMVQKIVTETAVFVEQVYPIEQPKLTK